ncbi:hypothetical protein BT69DRAFT_1385997 [Atractiella rhizophila]|nr:hypothetical protein BT69DRAFT_1385997 [Atractiella rhizophila]
MVCGQCYTKGYRSCNHQFRTNLDYAADTEKQKIFSQGVHRRRGAISGGDIGTQLAVNGSVVSNGSNFTEKMQNLRKKGKKALRSSIPSSSFLHFSKSSNQQQQQVQYDLEAALENEMRRLSAMEQLAERRKQNASKFVKMLPERDEKTIPAVFEDNHGFYNIDKTGRKVYLKESLNEILK